MFENEIKKYICIFIFEHEFLSVKKKSNVFKGAFRERINKLDPCFELFHAINKREHSRNPSDRQIHISYNQHSLPFVEPKLFA